MTKEYDVLEALNRQFVSIGPDLSKQIKSISDDDCLKYIIPENSEMLFVTVDETYNLNTINRLEKGKASGLYRLSSHLSRYLETSEVTPEFSRMLERLVHDQPLEFLKTNKRLTSNQAAFRKHYSTLPSLIGSTDYWYENIDHSKISLTIFLGLKKAFNTVNHSVLMKNYARMA